MSYFANEVLGEIAKRIELIQLTFPEATLCVASLRGGVNAIERMVKSEPSPAAKFFNSDTGIIFLEIGAGGRPDPVPVPIPVINDLHFRI